MTLYHLSHIDLDGYGCQFISHYFFRKHYYYNSNYGVEITVRIDTILSEITQSKDKKFFILISDLNLSTEDAAYIDKSVKALQENGKDIKLQLLDHHASGAETADQFEWYYLDASRCASKIVYDYMVEHFEPRSKKVLMWLGDLVDIINAIDIWLEDQSGFEYGKVLMRMINDTREINRFMFDKEHRDYKLWMLKKAKNYLNRPNPHILYDEAMHKFKKKYLRQNAPNDTLDNLSAQHVENLLSQKKEECTVYYKGYKGILVYAMGSISVVGNHFLKHNPEYAFIMDVSPNGRCSLRANGQIDVSEMSKELMGGGGHPNASGGKIANFKESFLYTEVKSFIESLIDKKGNNGQS